MDKISVIIPVYNVESYLEQCLQSVCDQTYHNLEIIVIDDGSTDNSYAIMKKFAASDHRMILLQQENQGLSAARNAGLDIASGEYISFIDSDDWIEGNMLEELYHAIINNQAEMSVCGYIRNGKHFMYVPDFPKNVIDGKEAVKNIVGKNSISFAAWDKLYRKNLFENIRFPVGRLFEDVYVTPRILGMCSRIAILDKPYYHYRIRPGSITNHWDEKTLYEKNLANKKFLDFIREYLKEDYYDELGEKVVYTNQLLNWIILTKFCDDKKYGDEIRTCRRYIIKNKRCLRYLRGKKWLQAFMVIYTPKTLKQLFLLKKKIVTRK